ncbi:tRNA intron endonuclease [Dipodascopsis tothii]|uniref:tRNA intron endonuclease n=1 Tax=Dipodascopsis tothii TaxID=44089 RepID=UPI0034CFE682
MSERATITVVDGEYFLFDLDDIWFLRNDHRVAGILVGTLPQVPQQSVFLGLPVQILPEEAALAVRLGVAQLVSAAEHEADGRRAAPRQPNEPFSTAVVSAKSHGATDAGAVAAIAATPRFRLYEHLQKRGYFMSPGLRFGAHFVAYPGDALRYHSHFLVRAVGWNEEFQLLDVVGSGRLGTGVKKAWVVGAARDDAEDAEVETFSIEWAGFG